MKVVELLKVEENSLKMLSESKSSHNDWQYVRMYEEYHNMRNNGIKARYVASSLARNYNIGVSTVFKIVNRLDSEINL